MKTKMEVSPGDLVTCYDRHSMCILYGVVLRLLNSDTLPCLVEVMWNDGTIYKTWTDELEIKNE